MADTFNIEIKGLDRLVSKLAKAPEKVRPIMQEAVNRSMAIVNAHATDHSAVPWVTGTLARSFAQGIRIGKLQASIRPTVDYARAVQYGMPASPGRFVPAIGRRLVDSSRRGFGSWPGFKGRHFMEKLRSRSRAEINEEFRSALRKATEAVAKS